MPAEKSHPKASGKRGRFVTTRWSLVRAAQEGATLEAREALETLCAGYWYPLYAYVRRRGYDREAAQDLTQAFFAKLLEKKSIGAARPERGKFRSFLLKSLEHFLANEWKREGGKRSFETLSLRLDIEAAERHYRGAAADTRTPERLFEKAWALATLEHATRQLAEEYAAKGHQVVFDKLKGFLLEKGKDHPYREVAGELGVSEDRVRLVVHRMRRRFRELVREEIQQTVETAAEAEEEMRFLVRTLGGYMERHK